MRSAVIVREVRTEPGDYSIVDEDAHRLRLHVGPPVRVRCRSHRKPLLRMPGMIDVLPAGGREAWYEADASRTLEVVLPADSTIAARYHTRDPQLEHLLRALSVDGTDPLVTDAIARAVLARLRTPAPVPVPRAMLSARELERVVAFIEQHLAESLTLERIAEVIGAGASHAHELLRASLGMPLHRYVIGRRLDVAARLLRDTSVPIAEVALVVGFAHQSHLSRWMRRLDGRSPGQIRRERTA